MIMKPLLLLLLTSLTLVAEPIILTLEHKDYQTDDYASQIEAAFAKVLAADVNLTREFVSYESPPEEEASGRYSSDPVVAPILLSESEEVEFRGDGGTRNFERTIALYYRFDEGMRRGVFTRSGFFALFTVKGELTYLNSGDDNFELDGATVTAEFERFSRELKALSPDEYE